uniref:Uncharacterized protein n=1 Tax=Arion vulgaris TaxID=1028688 RepID=A0A0B7B594_9EUPU
MKLHHHRTALLEPRASQNSYFYQGLINGTHMQIPLHNIGPKNLSAVGSLNKRNMRR